MLGIFLLGALTRRATSTGSMTGGVLGVLTVLLVITQTQWSFFYLGLIGTLSTFLLGLTVSLFTSTPSKEQIRGLVVGEVSPVKIHQGA